MPRKRFVDPIYAALNAELAKVQAERADLPSKVDVFRKKHKVTDAQCQEMIRALAEGRATTLEDAFDLARIGIAFPPGRRKKKR